MEYWRKQSHIVSILDLEPLEYCLEEPQDISKAILLDQV